MEEKVVNNEYMDNALKSVSDEMLAKRKRRNLITFSVISSLCLALVIIVVTMSVVRVNIKPYFIKPSSTIEVTIDGKDSTYDDGLNEENYNKLINAINGSFETQYLSALFAGDVGGYKIEEDKHKNERFYSTFSDGVGTGMYSTLETYLGKNYVHFQYNELQTLYSANGEKYESVVSLGGKTIEYRDVYFTISSVDEWSKTTFYFGSCTNISNRIVSITVSANTYQIYKLINDIQK